MIAASSTVNDRETKLPHPLSIRHVGQPEILSEPARDSRVLVPQPDKSGGAHAPPRSTVHLTEPSQLSRDARAER